MCVLILHAEHTMNASTFSARVTASTLADPYTVIASSVGTLAGPLHGGANEEAILQCSKRSVVWPMSVPMSSSVSSQIPSTNLWDSGIVSIKASKIRGRLFFRIWHEQLFQKFGGDPYYDIALELEQVLEEHLGPRGIYPNVDYYSGLVYRKMGIPADLFTPVFAIARVAGWLAHWNEQLQENRIFRPTQIYTGLHQQDYMWG